MPDAALERSVPPEAPPEARLRIGSCDVLLLGTIAGFVPDAARVQAAFDAHKPDHVALGIPAEDLEPLRVLAAHADPATLIGRHQEPPVDRRRRFTDPGLGAAGLDELTRPRQNVAAAQKQAAAPVAGQGAGAGAASDDELPFAGLDAATVRFLELLGRFGPTRIPSPDLATAYAEATAAGVAITAIDLDDQAHAAAYTKGMKVLHLMGANRRERQLLQRDFAQATDAYDLARRWDVAQAGVRPLERLERLREAHMAKGLRSLAASSQRLLAIVPVARLAGVQAALAAGL